MINVSLGKEKSHREVWEMKKELGTKMCLYPMPIALVGANVGGKPNYITIAHVGILDYGHVSLSMGKGHYTNPGIKENGTFSVNIPSVGMVKETDYCGLVSGRKADKGALFETFYGALETAPMIEECPVNMECRLADTVDMPRNDVFVGEIVQTYCDEGCLMQDGKNPDFVSIRPILFISGDASYYNLGERLAQAWDVGRELMDR